MNKQATLIADDSPTESLPAAATPMDLLSQVAARGADADELGKWMDLQERWQKGQASQAFARAMADAQAEMPVVVKDRENSHTRSRYASLENVQKTIKAVYLKHGFTVSVSEEPSQDTSRIRVKAVVRHRDGHSETYYREGPNDSVGAKGNATKTELHGAASTVTYLTRHLICGIFAVTIADHDDDGNQGEDTKFITEQQKAELHKLLVDTGGDVSGFLRYMEVEELATLPASKFAIAKNAINEAARARAKREASK